MTYTQYGVVYADSTTTTTTGSALTFDGTAFATTGTLAVGGSVGGGNKVRITGNTPTASGNEAVGLYSTLTFQSDCTTAGSVFYSSPSTQAYSFTMTTLRHFYAVQGTIGSGSSITNQMGFHAHYSLSGATHNYGCYSDLAAGSDTYNFYANGTADNWFSGNVMIGGAGKLGYTTGSGGAVEQTTSRTTGVTLNKTNGAITLCLDTPAAGYKTFVVTNNTVASTDVVIVCQQSGPYKYGAGITAIGTESFAITVWKILNDIDSDQPVFNFAVIKAATS